MDRTPFKDISFAYQLHYHFAFRTKFRKPVLSTPDCKQFMESAVEPICERSRCHALEHSVEADSLLCLLSLRPAHLPCDVARVVKTNSSREFNARFPHLAASFKDRALWAKGYFVRSVGTASRKAVEGCIESQGQHHGIRSPTAQERIRWSNPRPPSLRADHSTFDLSYHVVLVTSKRAEVFDDSIAPGFFETTSWYAERNGFYISRMSLLSDHTHMLLRTTPTTSIKDCVIGLMNQSWNFMMDRYYGVLKNTEAFDLWTYSAYVATVGEVTTAQIKSFLSRDGG